jgi:hypothetical protein
MVAMLARPEGRQTSVRRSIRTRPSASRPWSRASVVAGRYPIVGGKETDAVPFIRAHVAPGTTVHADEAPGWDRLYAYYDMKRINHGIAFSMDGAGTNWAESFFSRLRRMEIGQNHRISGKYLLAYVSEAAWKEDHRRVDNGAQHRAVAGLALAHPVSRIWAGYWQRSR